MSTFSLTHDLLQRLCAVNQFMLPETSMLLVGLRGAVTSNANDQSFKSEQLLETAEINYSNPRCTILQWDMANRQLAAFPASTVPNRINVSKSLAGGERTNCLLTGYYQDYRKGIHKAGTPTAHEAFRQNAVHPFRRTSDDLDFENDDRIEYDNPHDNIHCGWFQGLDSTNYASAGCQVIMGFPKCDKPGRDKNIGPWQVFHDNAYALPQNSFPYVLVNGREASEISTMQSAKLRFGSQGPLVAVLQQALKVKGFYEGIVDSDFGERTLKALIGFQQQKFGINEADGIVGPITAQELGINLSL
ncbi:peptidoglycan-binding domain-containing protein [Chryseolinea soli]|uniref:Peptidoglycan binding-like domain-containing protein n=1 Tax=Chryseolinea soli TaxID=2321403 RepID=A0A385SIW0_9BACT|nr:peptidoglycan-binding protein [Chryseolinea soli]AYB30416.1 hypothetical protein D4L85_07405 [Chryseolinea soli]